MTETPEWLPRKALARQRRERGYEVWALSVPARSPRGIMTIRRDDGRRPLPPGPRPSLRTCHAPACRHCHLGLGKLYRRTGDHAKAEEHLTTATAMYREMNMRFWREQADAAIAEVG